MEEILEILEQNSRYTDEEIAVMAGKTVEEVREAIRDYVSDLFSELMRVKIQ